MKRIFVLSCLLFAFLAGTVHTSIAQESTRKVVTRVSPQYPNIARAMNLQGSVKADVLVAPNGTVKSVQIKGGHPLLGQAAESAIREWKWEPASHETHEIIELKFTL
jgi:TonB family protein